MENYVYGKSSHLDRLQLAAGYTAWQITVS